MAIISLSGRQKQEDGLQIQGQSRSYSELHMNMGYRMRQERQHRLNMYEVLDSLSSNSHIFKEKTKAMERREK